MMASLFGRGGLPRLAGCLGTCSPRPGAGCDALAISRITGYVPKPAQAIIDRHYLGKSEERRGEGTLPAGGSGETPLERFLSRDQIPDRVDWEKHCGGRATLADAAEP